MGYAPILPLLLKISLPMVISMLVQALYNVVDSLFVAQLSENALSAVSLAFPIQNLMVAVGVGTGIGISSLLSKRLGEKNWEAVTGVAGNAIILAIFSYLLFLLFGIFGTHPFFDLQTDSPLIRAYGYNYLSVVSIFSFGLFGQVCFERLLHRRT
jgi:Na+-driven multidrug efflux pump